MLSLKSLFFIFLPLENMICLSKDVWMLTKKATSTGHKPYKYLRLFVCFILHGVAHKSAFVAQDSRSPSLFLWICMNYYYYFLPLVASSFGLKSNFLANLFILSNIRIVKGDLVVWFAFLSLVRERLPFKHMPFWMVI